MQIQFPRVSNVTKHVIHSAMANVVSSARRSAINNVVDSVVYSTLYDATDRAVDNAVSRAVYCTGYGAECTLKEINLVKSLF